MRDDRPFGGQAPAALFYASRDRRAEHPARHVAGYTGILQADAYCGYDHLRQALCWSHARRKFFELADIAASRRRGKKKTPISPLALEAVNRIGAIFAIEREINRLLPETRLAMWQERSKPLVAGLEGWMRAERARLSRSAPVAKAMDYVLPRWGGFTSFLEDGRICLSNNAAERALRGLALGRKKHGCSPDRIAAPSGPRSCIP